MLTKLAHAMYQHAEGDTYTINVVATGGASIGPATLCGVKNLTFPATIGPADYGACTKNYQVNIIVRFLDATGLATVTVSSGDTVVESFPVSAPPNTPGDKQIVLAFKR
jgi:hypothetical protein